MSIEELIARITPGEWRILPPRWKGDTDAARVICNAQGESIGEMSAGFPQCTDAEQDANAKAVALVPQLLALAAAVDALDRHIESVPDHGCTAMEAAEFGIAKDKLIADACAALRLLRDGGAK